MADIRINSLPTTASASSSDDFLALDGATNGTRKLNAYSPTFGGNLTVSGTGTNAFTGDIALTRTTGNPLISITNGAGGSFPLFQFFDVRTGGYNWNIEDGRTLGTLGFYCDGATRFSITNAGNATLAGNLTVSGGETVVTGNVPWYSAKFTGSTGRTGGGVRWLWSDGTNPVAIISRNTTADDNLEFYTGSALRATLNSSGNLLVGTTTDSGNGKLQLATHTTSAGGIGFGTDVALNRLGTGSLQFQSSSPAVFYITHSSASTYPSLYIASDSNNYYIGRGGTPSAANDMLTFASSDKSATFAGGVTINGKANFSWLGANGPVLNRTDGSAYFILNKSNGVNGVQLSATSVGALSFYTGDGLTLAATLSSSSASFVGAISIGNTVQTAVAVASTHKVTISIGGTTYYLLATNV